MTSTRARARPRASPEPHVLQDRKQGHTRQPHQPGLMRDTHVSGRIKGPGAILSGLVDLVLAGLVSRDRGGPTHMRWRTAGGLSKGELV